MQYKFYLSATGQNVVNWNYITQSNCYYSSSQMSYYMVIYGIIQIVIIQNNRIELIIIFIFNYPIINFNYLYVKTYKVINTYF